MSANPQLKDDDPLSYQKELAAALMAEDYLTDVAIAVRVGVSAENIKHWRRDEAVRDRILFYRRRFRESVKDCVFADKRIRIRVLNRMALEIGAQLFETDFTALEQLVTARGQVVDVLRHDSSKLASFLKILSDIAAEVGDRRNSQKSGDVMGAFMTAASVYAGESAPGDDAE